MDMTVTYTFLIEIIKKHEIFKKKKKKKISENKGICS